MEIKKKKTYSPEIALTKIMSFCAYQERTQQEVRDKLYSYGLHSKDVEEIILKLIQDKFVDETRFAKLYSGGKFRIKKWGKNKILQGLKQEGLSEYNIKKAMLEIDDKEYKLTLVKVLEKKLPLIKETDTFKLKQKLARFAIGKGYEPDLVWEEVNKIYK